jgi:hypothetical protein
MSRLIIIFAVAFITALAGGAGSATMQAKKVAAVMLDSLKKAEADSLKKVAKADSLKAKEPGASEGEHVAAAEGADSAHKGDAKGDPKAAGHAEGEKVVAGLTAKGDHGAAEKDPKATAAAKPVKDSLLPSGVIGERLGKIFTAMASKDAVKVMEKLDDQDIALILSKLNDKKAAEILALLPPDRAAAISKGGIAHVTHLAKAEKP